MQDFRRLEVWRKAHKLVLTIYRVTADFPKKETYGLTGQLKRAAISIPSNIAEGCGRGGRAELAQYLKVARGSGSEVDYHLELARDLELLSAQDHELLQGQLSEVQRMLTSLRERVRGAS